MKRIIPLICVVVLCVTAGLIRGDEPESVPLAQVGTRYLLVGKLHEPMGQVVTAVGVVIEGAAKGYETGPNLRILRLGGKATQEDIQICIRPYFSDWGKKPSTGSGVPLPKLEIGKTYEMEGYESGGYVGVPADAYEKAGAAIQTTPFCFHEEFVVYRAKLVEPRGYKPSDSGARKALQ